MNSFHHSLQTQLEEARRELRQLILYHSKFKGTYTSYTLRIEHQAEMIRTITMVLVSQGKHVEYQPIDQCARLLESGVTPSRITVLEYALARAERLQNIQPSFPKSETSVLPPKWETYLLWYIPAKDREEIIGDMEERFRRLSREYGYAAALRWYRMEVARSFWPYLSVWLEKLLKWGVLGWVGDILRHLIS